MTIDIRRIKKSDTLKKRFNIAIDVFKITPTQLSKVLNLTVSQASNILKRSAYDKTSYYKDTLLSYNKALDTLGIPKTNEPKEDLKQSFKDAENRKDITVHKTVDSLMESLNDEPKGK